MAKKILIVDDEPDITLMLKARLEANGYQTDVAYDGHAALEMVKKNSFDLIILDLMLPKIDGYSVCRMLKFDDKYKKIPIIIFTARAESADKKLAEEVGADDYVTKPYVPEILLGKIKRLLNE